MVKDGQVGVLRRRRMEGKTQEAAAAAAGMSVGSARKWEHGAFPSQRRKPHMWRTREDPFAEVFEREVVALLAADEKQVLEARTILGELGRRHPGEFSVRQLRTLQRRMRQWRALNGPDKEVFFPQEHPPGREAAYDFTNCDELGVTICGAPFDHLLFELALGFSGWRWATVALSESYEALLLGVQEAIWRLGGVVEVLRSDNLSAATHELPLSVNAELNCHFFADADVPRLTNSLFLAPDTIAGCVGSYAVPPPDDFAESRAGAAVFSGAC
jgi:transcriptional regulator with XRE-family HTH domain